MFFSKKSIYNIYLNFFTLKGKKSVAKKNIDRSLFLVSQQIKIPVFLVLYFYITKLNIIVETKISQSFLIIIELIPFFK